ncbi:YbaN family protein [Staphylococcus hyicus]|uniref:YbaN family protein n=1 Tax=Staphylococcus hyicus TaxID=1284 RepID=A0ACD5FJ63_STAHY|nr:YbaN family protein [Staphylococcus hyicus]MDP4460735.1 YbaN family protein [Staphylococcus hyicus]MDP4463781.1 YbaN family protein [Staphylococcus hyicus]
MKYILLMVGITCTILGFVGVVVPLLPTTPFLLLAAICFAKSSERFKNWLIHTKVYREYVESFKNERGYTLIKKFKLLISLYIGIAFSIYMIDHTMIRVMLLIMVCFQTIFLFTFVKTLPNPSKER